jgi:hypothetical protein
MGKVSNRTELDSLQRYVYVPYPQVQHYQMYDDYTEHSIPDVNGDGVCIEEEWLYEHTT